MKPRRAISLQMVVVDETQVDLYLQGWVPSRIAHQIQEMLGSANRAKTLVMMPDPSRRR